MYGIFTDSFVPIMDGVTITAYNYAYWLKNMGHDVCVVTPSTNSNNEALPFPVYHYPSIPVPGRKPYRYGLELMTFRIKNELLKKNISLVHAHSPFTTGRIARRIAKSKGIPFVATFHSKYRQDFEKAVHYTPIVNWMVKEILSFFESADEVWIPQEVALETLREYGYKGNVVVMENGNDLADYADKDELRNSRRAQLGLLPNELMFLFVGQQIKQKNIPLIIDSLALLKDLPFKMYFIGEGNGKLDFKKQVDSLGLSDKVTFTGVIRERKEIASYFAAADLFLFPSMYDTSGLVVKEAAAMLTPSLLIEGSMASCSIIHGKNGFLASETPEAYANTIRKITEQPELLQRVGERAYATLAQSWEGIVEQVEVRYKELINSKKKHIYVP